MKIRQTIKITVGFFFALVMGIMEVGCEQYTPTDSHYGHGAYHCYYQNTHSGEFYEATDAPERTSKHVAKSGCNLTARLKDCAFADCLFR